MSGVWSWIMGFFFRWFPHRTLTGLKAVGRPDQDSPVIVTGNYSLTITRLLKGLHGLDLWLLVADSGGINVWCAACGGRFTHHQVISAVRTSRLGEVVRGRALILPPLSAPGIDIVQIHEKTGFHVRFGPVYARDIAAYLGSGGQKTEAMKRADFGLGHRVDKIVSMNFIMWIPLAMAFLFLRPDNLFHVTALFWGITVFLYVFFPWLPGKNGWIRSLSAAGLVAAGYLIPGYLIKGNPAAFWSWMLGGVLLTLMVGFDLAGIAGPMPSDPSEYIRRLGIGRIGFLYSDSASGNITLDKGLCRGCTSICNDICPIGVHGSDEKNHKAVLERPELCFACGACVKQCPTGALQLGLPPTG